jgi:ATP-binding cassette subfamily F protein 3
VSTFGQSFSETDSLAQLHLARGRRYGLVGRNGTGKTTLMRAISGREIAVPRSVRVLHVEQEVTFAIAIAIGCIGDLTLFFPFFFF